jgi:simple sugar transport system permease protein
MRPRLNKSLLPFAITAGLAVLLYVAAGLKFEGFFSLGVLSNFFTDNAVLGITSIGLTFVILSGEIDLSVGALIAFTSMLIARLVMGAGWHPLAAAALALAAGAVFGLLQGLLVHFCRIPGFLVTLGGLFLARGLSFVLKLEAIPIEHPFLSRAADWRTSMAGGKFELPAAAGIFLAVFAVALIHAQYTRLGRNV